MAFICISLIIGNIFSYTIGHLHIFRENIYTSCVHVCVAEDARRALSILGKHSATELHPCLGQGYFEHRHLPSAFCCNTEGNVSLCYPTEHGSLFFDDIMVIGPDRQD
jgi:hypothetical protein